MAAPHLSTHPAPYSDTDPRAMEVWIKLQRGMPSGDNIQESCVSSTP